ncbi:redoxin domain-containing protein [Rhizobium laguerreae]|uniref:redoxin domain-containing protein n=1 Tax=Rhizobium TaxID=379 RepID=UPI00103A8EC9|nr:MULTISPECIES: redoxin domain-containing protein [Rhizobium]MBB3525800.1 peroxiredoxin [Rhizobium sp. BK456]MBY3397178.1 redoxin domain-containing protein [Rhizobium laguerreae]MBY3417104.1 redoxin domain-containing protein [Rhizobium laguerreae]MBY3424918.1 redoxin domain-containing protein [Rhizobium laguerreae]MBY3496389.1 redoxin domain-containing protein [Rhizobium laguerreae]
MTSSLNLGSPAPSIKVKDWLRGDPFSNFQLGNIYIIEFFSTTCGYCGPELSDLAKLHKKFYTGVEFIGIAASEEAATADDARVQVDASITKSLPNTSIRMGFDHSGEMNEVWLKASLSFHVPKTFVVDRDCSIAFIGDLIMLEDVLPKVIDGSWRASAEAKNAEKERIAEGETYAAAISSMIESRRRQRLRHWKTALSAIEEGINLNPDLLAAQLYWREQCSKLAGSLKPESDWGA